MIKSIFFFILFSVVVYAQTAPSGYTNHLRLRLYAGNTGVINPGKDSLDANYIDIDAGVKAVYDTINNLKADYYYQHNYGGSHKNGSITWDNLSIAAKSAIVQIAGTQTITGQKTFNGNSTFFRRIEPISDNVFDIGGREDRFRRGYFGSVWASEFRIYNVSRTDSALISLEDSVIKFNKDVQLSGIVSFEPSADGVGRIGQDGKQFNSVWADTVASDSTLKLYGKQGGVHFKTELITPPLERILTSASTSFDVTHGTFIKLISPDAVTNLHTITFNSIGGAIVEGQRITVMNMSNVNITLKHATGTLRNIGSVDVVLGQYDSVDYILVDIGGGSFRWIMTNHSNI